MVKAEVSPKTALERAIWEARGQSALARMIGVLPQSISQYVRKGFPPEERCAAIEAATGVRCEELRPDVQWIRGDDGAVTGYVCPVEAVSA